MDSSSVSCTALHATQLSLKPPSRQCQMTAAAHLSLAKAGPWQCLYNREQPAQPPSPQRILLAEVPHLLLDCAKRSGPAWSAAKGSLCTAWRLSTSHAPVSSLTSSWPEGLKAMLESTPDTSGTRHRDCRALAGSASRVKTYLQEVRK